MGIDQTKGRAKNFNFI